MGMPRDKATVRKVIRKADAGDTEAMMEYCSWFSDIDKMTADRETRRRILRYLRAGAKAGDANMLCNIGAEYYGGGLVKRDFAKAMHYYELSAAKGCVQALSNLGYCYYYGRSIPVDYRKAFECFLKAYVLSPFGMPEVCYKLGDCFRSGRGVETDVIVARRFYELAYRYSGYPTVSTFAEIEDSWNVGLLGADAAFRLGECHRLGLGSAVDLKRAARFYRIAVAGFKRKMEFGDCFAPPLWESAKARLREVRDAIVER